MMRHVLIPAPFVIIFRRGIILPGFGLRIRIEVHFDIIDVAVHVAEHIQRIEKSVVIRSFPRIVPRKWCHRGSFEN